MEADSAATDAAQTAAQACMRLAGDAVDNLHRAWLGGEVQGDAAHAGALAVWQALCGALLLACLLLAAAAGWSWRGYRRALALVV